MGTATSIVLLLLLWQELMRVALSLTSFILPSFLPLWPLYVVPAAAVDIWYGLVQQRPQAVGYDAAAGLLFAGVFVGVVYGESGASTNVFWSPHVLPLSTLLAGVAGAVSGWAGALLARRLLTPGVSAGRRWTRAPTGAAP
jgi:hypothetical protein